MGIGSARRHKAHCKLRLRQRCTRTAGWPARAVMRIAVADIHKWRLNLWGDVSASRFDAVTKVVESRLRTEAGADKIRLPKNGLLMATTNCGDAAPNPSATCRCPKTGKFRDEKRNQ